MRSVGLALLALSLVLGAVAVWGLRNFSSAQAVPAPATPMAAMTTVVVASRPISFGEAIGPGVLKAQPWPANAVPPGSYRSVQELTSAQPRLALAPIAANEPILPTRISGPGGRATLSGVIRTGMRAATIRIDDVMGVAGFVLPGDFVDVLVTRREGQDSSATMRTDILLEGVRVLAVDQTASDNKNDPLVAKAATIEVSPGQAQKLALAGQVGTLSLALRSTQDPLSPNQDVRTIRTSDLRVAGAGQSAAASDRPRVTRVASRPAASGPEIKVFRAGEPTAVRVRAE
ncbi:Flp pilus assembly protein CpaB [Phenylobacterium sp.]|jgi:pilus assembly protein CpaB|uniref:Flp pilus assembly protein CpaB n=1 Tax=Phenylobacterium sp. TaxID=1871053 RepID=UPI002F94A9E6